MRPLQILRRVLVVFGLAACGGSTVTDTPSPTAPVDTTKPPTTVQRASITARVTIDPVDADLAQRAGIGVSRLTVRLTSSRAGDPVRTAVTEDDGTVRFDNLLEASYSASVERRLTADELSRLAPVDREASMFAGGGQVVLSPPTGRSVDVALVGARRGSIVISEIFAFYGPPERGFDNYVYGSYLEVYNNSDTTAYLDGILYLVTPPTLHRSNPQSGTCDALPKNLRIDSSAVYTGVITAFPGSGRDFPIRPGEAKVVAMDAINHATAAPVFRQLDLSRADFEQFWTDGDVDNPFAANILRVYGSTAGVFGRGFGFMVNSGQAVLLVPEARARITEVTVPGWSAAGWGTFTAARVPSEYILDLVALDSAIPPIEGAAGYCAPWTSPRYDRAPAMLSNFLVRQAISRRSLGRTAAGHEILQRTRNSARDFMLAEPLRRSLDK